MVVAFGGDEGGQGGYNDTTAAGAVAAFMLVRGQHWLFSIGPNGGSGGKSYPPYDQDSGTLTPATAKILTVRTPPASLCLPLSTLRPGVLSGLLAL